MWNSNGRKQENDFENGELPGNVLHISSLCEINHRTVMKAITGS